MRPEAPVRRPEAARPREAEVPEAEPPSPAELARIQLQLCRLPELDGAEVVDDPGLRALVVRRRGPAAGYDHVSMPRWEADDWRERLAQAAVRLTAMDAWPSLLLCDELDRPPGMAERLPDEGWVPVGAETVLWAAHAPVVPHLDPSLRIEAVAPRRVDIHEALERRIFGLPESLADARREAISAALATGRLRAWVVWLSGEPVAVARLAQGDGVAGLQGIGVVTGRRRQGIGSLVTIVATRAGMALGNRIVWLSVRDDDPGARQMYHRLGYRRAFSWSRWFTREDPR
jgi:ribosomal protein S18 acetylase RimI-like enzyme